MVNIAGIFAAVVAIIGFVAGFLLVTFDPVEWGIMVVEVVSSAAPTEAGSDAANNGILALRLLGVAIIIGDVLAIVGMIRAAAK